MKQKTENDTKISRPTIKEVAAKAHVSLSTVSRVLREPGKMPVETVSKVLAAAKSLRYVYNANAGNLSSQKSNTLGILIPSPVYSAFGTNLIAIQEVCSERNFSCRVAVSQFSAEQERIALQRFHEQRIGGLIMAGFDSSNLVYIRNMEADGIPCISMWETPDQNMNYIAVDNVRSIGMGIKYLIDLGHERLGLMLGPFSCAQRTYERLTGYKKILAAHNIPYDPDLVCSHPPSLLYGKEGMRAFLRLENPPTAVLCVNDYLAIGAIRAINEAGLKVNEDISVCGFDDVEISAYFNPPLTTIKTPCYEMGQMAANMMIDAIEEQKPLKVQYLLDTELIIRSTCSRRKTTN